MLGELKHSVMVGSFGNIESNLDIFLKKSFLAFRECATAFES